MYETIKLLIIKYTIEIDKKKSKNSLVSGQLK